MITWLACPRVILQASSAAGCWAELEDVIVAVMSCLWHRPINEKFHVPVKLRNLLLGFNHFHFLEVSGNLRFKNSPACIS